MSSEDSVRPRPGIGERLAQLIRLPTVSAELEERGTAPFEELFALLGELYPRTHAALDLERHGQLGLLFRWRGRSDADPLVLMAHTDVVPAEEADGWTHPPFAGVVADGLVHGRGALDDKGPLVVALEAVENLLAAGFVPARDVYLSFGGNEETQGDAAALAAASLRERGVVPWLVLDEGGAVVEDPLPRVHGSFAMIGVGEKGVLSLRLEATGAPGHASAPPPLTAVRRVARAVDRLGPETFPPRTAPAVTRMLELLAPHAEGPARALYRALAASPRLSARVLAAQGGEGAAMVRTTVAATMLSGGSAVNVLPARAEATLNLRLGLGETVAGTVERVRRRIRDPQLGITVLEGEDPSPASPVDSPAFAALAGAVAEAYPGTLPVPYVMMQASDARHYHRFAPAVYRFAPLSMDAAQRASIHGVDEHVTVDALERGERFHRALLEGL